MNESGSRSTRSLTTIRWVARIIAILSIAVFLAFFTADCVKKGTIAIGSDRLVMTVFMFLAFIGLISAWKWEGLGGAMALGGLIAFNILAPASEGGNFVVTGLCGLPALLFIFCWWQTRKQLKPKAT